MLSSHGESSLFSPCEAPLSPSPPVGLLWSLSSSPPALPFALGHTWTLVTPTISLGALLCTGRHRHEGGAATAAVAVTMAMKTMVATTRGRPLTLMAPRHDKAPQAAGPPAALRLGRPPAGAA